MIEKVSRPIEKFQVEANRLQKITEGKNIAQIEKLFWKSLMNNAPLYGADVSGSLFDNGVPWNLAEIQTILNQGLNNN